MRYDIQTLLVVPFVLILIVTLTILYSFPPSTIFPKQIFCDNVITEAITETITDPIQSCEDKSNHWAIWVECGDIGTMLISLKNITTNYQNFQLL